MDITTKTALVFSAVGSVFASFVNLSQAKSINALKVRLESIENALGKGRQV